MCVIIQLFPDQEISHEKLFNAAANNWHSWGILIRKGKNLELIRGVNPKGSHEDIPRIKEILEENKNHMRYIHFRYATHGAHDLDNCHPFTIYEDKDRKVFLMHNGTFTGVGAGYQGGQQRSESDTKLFIRDYLQEPLRDFVKGDYNNPTFKKYVLDKLYFDKGARSRILFVSTFTDDLFLGDWNDFYNTQFNEDGSEKSKTLVFKASNNDYFTEVTRGPLHEQRKEEERRRAQEQQKTQQEQQNKKVEVTRYKRGMFSVDPEVTNGIKLILETHGSNVSTSELDGLYQCSIPEYLEVIEELIKENKKELIAYFFDYIMGEYFDIQKQNSSLQKKLKSAEGRIRDFNTFDLSRKDIKLIGPPIVKQGEQHVG